MRTTSRTGVAAGNNPGAVVIGAGTGAGADDGAGAGAGAGFLLPMAWAVEVIVKTQIKISPVLLFTRDVSESREISLEN